MGGSGSSGVRLLADMHEAARLREERDDLRDRLTYAEHALEAKDIRIATVRRLLRTLDLPAKALWELDALLTGDNTADVAA